MAFNDETETFRTTLEVSTKFAEHLASVESKLSNALQPALQPYRAGIRISGRSIEFAGDQPAAIALKRVVEEASDAHERGEQHATIWAPQSLAKTLEDALQRDLAFRVSGLRNAVRPMSMMQHAFMDTLLAREPAMVIGAGPTGTGKTHLAIAAGINLVSEGRYKHLIIARPHVFERGEVVTAETRADTTYDSQFEAIEDELNDLLPPDQIRQMKEARKLEILPIGRMRGRTFQNAFIIVDEAQNMNVKKTRMAVTRLGESSRIVLTGDPSHAELREEGPSGLEHLINMVEGSDFARVFRFTVKQIIRNPVVSKLEALYEADSKGA